MKPMVLRPLDERALSATTREACAAESVPRTPQLKSRGPCLAANPRHLTSTGGVTALGVQTRRAKHGARATEPTPLPTPSTPPIDRRRSHDDRSAAGTPVAVAARRRVDVRSRRDAGAGPTAGDVPGLRARAVAAAAGFWPRDRASRRRRGRDNGADARPCPAAAAVRGHVERVDDDPPLRIRRRAGRGRKDADAQRRGSPPGRRGEAGAGPGRARGHARRSPGADLAHAGRGRGVARRHGGARSADDGVMRAMALRR